MYPHHMLSSHFLTDQQRSDLAKTASTIRAHHLQSLLETRETRERLKELEEHLKVVRFRRKKMLTLCWLEISRALSLESLL